MAGAIQRFAQGGLYLVWPIREHNLCFSGFLQFIFYFFHFSRFFGGFDDFPCQFFLNFFNPGSFEGWKLLSNFLKY
jgi:hypothetical protein